MWTQLAGGGLKAMGTFRGATLPSWRRSHLGGRSTRRQQPRRLYTSAVSLRGGEIYP
jgi:hypothetical protein